MSRPAGRFAPALRCATCLFAIGFSHGRADEQLGERQAFSRAKMAFGREWFRFRPKRAKRISKPYGTRKKLWQRITPEIAVRVAELWKQGIPSAEIDALIREADAVARARQILGREALRRRALGGKHGDNHKAGSSTSCGTFRVRPGVQDRPLPALDADLINAVEHAYWHMTRPVMQLLELRQRVRKRPWMRCWWYPPLREFCGLPPAPELAGGPKTFGSTHKQKRPTG